MSRYWMIVLEVILVIVAVSCGGTSMDPEEKDDDDNTGMTPAGTISMSIDGDDWVSQIVAADTIRSGSLVVSLGISGVVGITSDAMGLAVASVSGLQETTYSYPTTSLSAFAFTLAHPFDTTRTVLLDPDQSTGQVVLSSLNYADGLVSGSFSFDAYREHDGSLVEIRNGVFNEIPIGDLSPGLLSFPPFSRSFISP